MIGISIHRVLLPVLQDYVGQEMPKHYATLKSTRGIDSQVYGGHLAHDKGSELNYESINNNWGKKKKLYDFRVGTSEDLAKLYLKPYMAKFTGEIRIKLIELRFNSCCGVVRSLTLVSLGILHL